MWAPYEGAEDSQRIADSPRRICRCNHIAGLLYALEEFVRLGLREESKLPCRSKLLVWNRPWVKKLPPSYVVEVAAVKEEFGKCKRRQVRPMFDPRPPCLRLANPQEQLELFEALQEEHQKQLESDITDTLHDMVRAVSSS